NENPLAAWFGRGTGHDEQARYSEKPEDWDANMARLARKFETARNYVPAAEIDEVDGAQLAIIAYGSTRYAIEEARDQLAAAGAPTNFMRLRALPFGPEVEEFIARHQNVLLLEM